MSILVPGKIVVVDDNIDIAMKEIVNPLWGKGEGVVYLQGPPSADACPSNTRLVILDLDLDGCGTVTEADLQNAALVLQRLDAKTKFYLIALWSIHIDEKEDWIDKIKEKYKEQTGKEIDAHFLKPFGKGLHEKVGAEIEKWITENPRAGIIFEWEKLIENARDRTTSGIIDEIGVDVIIRSIEKEWGKESIPREFIVLLNRILGRHINSYDQVTAEQLKKCVETILSQESIHADILKWFSKFYNFQAYYDIRVEEPICTGDIFMTTESDPDRKYAIVITPSCDFAQGKVDYIKVVYATRVDADMIKSGGAPELAGRFPDYLKGKSMPQRLYRLCFLKNPAKAESYFHLILNIQNTDSRKFIDIEKNKNKINGWQRVCRIDSPWIEDLLQRYASVSSRIGVPDIPKDVLESEAERLGKKDSS